MKYLLYTTKPEGSPIIGERDYVAPVECVEGWFVSIQFKQICVDFGWVNFTEVAAITPIKPTIPTA
jgi:hypothetical protein